MNPAHSFRSYRAVAAQTAPPGQLVVMLYDGAIRFLDCALAGFQHDDPKEFNETINNNIIRAQEIINELDGSLDVIQGGELAATLRRLYHYMDVQLTHSNARKSPEEIRDALHRLSILRDAWREMLVQRGGAQREPAPYASLAATS
jgi:flagellar secretion chaperone FliS